VPGLDESKVNGNANTQESSDLYTRLKALEKLLKFTELQENYVKEEQRNLKSEYLRAKEEVKRIQSVPVVIGQFLEMIDEFTGIVGSANSTSNYVRILSTIDRELLKPSASVALHRYSSALVDVLPPESDSSIQLMAWASGPTSRTPTSAAPTFRSKRCARRSSCR
jgi:26S proteasome regulatory subunit T3